MRFFDNIKTRNKIVGVFLIFCTMLIVVGVIGFMSTQNVDNSLNLMYSEELIPLTNIGTINTLFGNIRGDLYRYLVVEAEKAKTKETMDGRLTQIHELVDGFTSGVMTPDEEQTLSQLNLALTDFEKALSTYEVNIDTGNTAKAIEALGTGGDVLTTRQAVTVQLDKLMASHVAEAEHTREESAATFRSAWISIVAVALIALISAFLIGILLTNSINKPLLVMTKALNQLKDGVIIKDTDEKTKAELLSRKDEMGTALNALVKTEEYLQDLADNAVLIGNNDLRVEIKPKTENDLLGNAFLKMTLGLRETVRQISESASSLTSASSQLSTISTQSGEATSQIATTIQQVALGISQQTEGVTKTASSVEEMSRAINGVAQGAQEQANAASKSSTITGQLSSAIQQVAGNAEEVVRGSDKAADAAKEGSNTVRDTLIGLERIKDKVGISAKKVEEMGSRSDQIGAIITIIEDIASQTNLLALNAAIEAARAGEAGKGFAVVADEVRKLAERSSSSTKEIGTLIKGIQKTVSEAVTAMEDGANEIENGVMMAEKAGDALNAIQQAAQSVNEQAEQAAAAAQQMSASANELVAAVDSVSAVIEENTAATEEMAASSAEVSQSIEAIASVSEENSAAVEEVSASAEQISAQAEEVSAAADELANLAEDLQQVVDKFKL
jgi:methyl-accepting chemotaxis protein